MSSSNLVAFSTVSDQKLVSDVRTNQSSGAVVYNHWTGLVDRNGWTNIEGENYSSISSLTTVVIIIVSRFIKTKIPHG